MANYVKTFKTLASDPISLSILVQRLTGSSALRLVDILSLDAVECEAIQRPVYALIAIVEEDDTQTATKKLTSTTQLEATPLHGYLGWLPQTIDNACGLYAVVHAIGNSAAKDFCESGTMMTKLMSGKTVEARCRIMEDRDMEAIYGTVLEHANQAECADEEGSVENHYLTIVKLTEPDHLCVLDGERLEPLILNAASTRGEDVLGHNVLMQVRKFLRLDDDPPPHCAIMALVLDQTTGIA